MVQFLDFASAMLAIDQGVDTLYLAILMNNQVKTMVENWRGAFSGRLIPYMN